MLAFLCRREGLFAIPKSARVTRVLDNFAAGDLALDEEEIDCLESAFPLGRRRGLPMI